ncbi:hypothetical protein [Campylobacter hyointestinalis]|uniref:hypothetical protein n=1 Tax=Campylobacter hyointestinalis TaxID=198 RepID=UPI000CE427D0|nr:hypothetical protein [Campylobacter hyointestinalis]PPB52878.1 hypothetical protein CDQ67_09650 [Campylobacter hyointestinalis subsp. hyointestinalis]
MRLTIEISGVGEEIIKNISKGNRSKFISFLISNSITDKSIIKTVACFDTDYANFLAERIKNKTNTFLTAKDISRDNKDEIGYDNTIHKQSNVKERILIKNKKNNDIKVGDYADF